jgi:hypothetical protein
MELFLLGGIFAVNHRICTPNAWLQNAPKMGNKLLCFGADSSCANIQPVFAEYFAHSKQTREIFFRGFRIKNYFRRISVLAPDTVVYLGLIRLSIRFWTYN